MLDAKRAEKFALFGGSGGGIDFCADRAGHLDSRETHTSCCGMDKYGFTFLQMAGHNHRKLSRTEDTGQCCRLLERERLRLRHQTNRMRDDVFSEARCNAHHLITDARGVHTRTGPDDFSSAIDSE